MTYIETQCGVLSHNQPAVFLQKKDPHAGGSKVNQRSAKQKTRRVANPLALYFAVQESTELVAQT